ncbi:MAG: pantoate--beta-alanine ligase [Kiritimatiellia bacterium]
MKIVRSARSMQKLSRSAKLAGKTVGLVPTMGFLHEGHLSLIRKARKKCELLVVSLFVNPAQFGPDEDFSRYPRDPARDRRFCEKEKTDVLFCPKTRDVYCPDHSVFVNENDLSGGLCGASRPGHFRGVLTVVAKLFNIVQPDVAVFGRKDAQQLRIIERMVRDLNFPVRIVTAPIARESDGLAISSRNVYLSGRERARAVCLRESLCLCKRMYRRGTKDTRVIKSAMKKLIENGSPRVDIDYIEAVDYATLKPAKKIVAPTLVALAVYIGKTRLIDNTVVGE